MPKMLTYRGASDASGGVSVGKDTFVVADDENNVLRVYATSGPDLPLYSYDVSDFLDVDPDKPEADIEGAARVGNRIYWITSHGRNKDGKLRSSRYRFFATDIKAENSRIRLQLVGTPCRTLVRSLIAHSNTRELGLWEATKLGQDLAKDEREELAPKEEGLNIEGLCATPDGVTMYIGFRNPLVESRETGHKQALVIPLLNGEAVVREGQLPDFGQPILWDFDGLGIRSMEYSSYHKAYFIVAGRPDTTEEFRLYRWSGDKANEPTVVRDLSDGTFTPEAVISFDDSEHLLLLSDDGSIEVKVAGPHECIDEDDYDEDSGTCENKHLLNPYKKTFRGMWLRP